MPEQHGAFCASTCLDNRPHLFTIVQTLRICLGRSGPGTGVRDVRQGGLAFFAVGFPIRQPLDITNSLLEVSSEDVVRQPSPQCHQPGRKQ